MGTMGKGSARPKASQPCPCGSGKKYKDCHALKAEQRRKMTRQSKKVAAWVVGVALVAAMGYAISQTAGVPFTDRHLLVVDFSGLTASQKKGALRQANSEHCTCGCGMSLAQCVVTDSTCPRRSENITKIRTMVEEHSQEES